METQKWEYKLIGLSMFNRLNTYTHVELNNTLNSIIIDCVNARYIISIFE